MTMALVTGRYGADTAAWNYVPLGAHADLVYGISPVPSDPSSTR